jgi:uncharacterized protein (TIGR03000 family)
MLRKTLTGLAPLTLAGAVLVLAALPAHAGGPDSWPYPPSYYGYNLDDPHPGYYGGGRYRESYSYGRGYGLANYPPPYTGPLYWPNPGGFPRRPAVAYPWPVVPDSLAHLAAAPADTAAHLVVQVPDEAEVWIEQVKTQQTGATRRFVSPPLAAGTEYSYTIRARWTADGRAVERSKTVAVQAGAQVSVNFLVEPDREVLPVPKEDLPEREP